MLTDQQTAMLDRARAATFGQLRQQHLTEAEHRDCAVLVAAGLLKDVVGTTFMLTEAGRRYWPGKGMDPSMLQDQWQSATDEAGKIALLKQFSGVNIPLRPSMLGCSVEELDAVAVKSGFSLIWIRGGSLGTPNEPAGTWRRAACVAACFDEMHPARTAHVAEVAGWKD